MRIVTLHTSTLAGLALLCGLCACQMADPDPLEDATVVAHDDMTDMASHDAGHGDVGAAPLDEQDSDEDREVPDLMAPDMSQDAAIDVPDAEEPAHEPCEQDSDEDGLSDCEEARIGSYPQRPDSDYDGILDGEEVALGTDPISWDTDGDLLTDFEELQFSQLADSSNVSHRLSSVQKQCANNSA